MRQLLLVICGVVIVPFAFGQSAVTTNGGTVNAVPVFSSSSTVGNSSISDANGNVTMSEPLTINGGSINAPNATLNVTGYQQYSDGIGITISNLTGWPPSGATTNLRFASGWAPNGQAMIQSAVYDCCGYGGFLGFHTMLGGVLRETMRLDPWGNLGIGTQSPQSELSIVTPSADSETGEHILNTDPTGYSVLRLGVDAIAASGFGLHQFNSAWAGDSSGPTPPSGTSLLAFEAGGMILDTTHPSAAIKFFTGGSSVERMRIAPSGYVGIGTASPSATLEVNGGIKMTAGSGGGITFPDGTTQRTGLNVTNLQTGGGTSASNYLQFNANNGIPSYIGNVVNGQSDWSFNTYFDGSNWIYATSNPTAAIRMASNVGMMAFYTTVAGPAGSNVPMDTAGPKMSLSLAGGLSLGNAYTTTDPGAGSLIVAGNIGIGTTMPGAALEVDGSIKLTANSGASMTFQDGSVQTVAWNGTTLGGDYAESIDVQGDRTTYEPGDVIAIDASSPGKFLKSATPYSKLVAGVYSTKPGLVGRRTTIARIDKEAEVPMAMMGIAPTKVSNENGPIEPGDLLVTSSTPGYAMKGTDRDHLTGAVIGKALAPLKAGTGIIEVLISLQ